MPLKQLLPYPSIDIEEVKLLDAGAYTVKTLTAQKSFEVVFSSLFAGEFRDILLEMELPASGSTDATENKKTRKKQKNVR